MGAEPWRVSFLATIALLQSAIQIAGDGGCRIKLDVDDTGIDAVMALSAMRGQVLRVTVELEKQTGSNGKPELETGPKRKPRWTASEKPSTHNSAGESGQPDCGATGRDAAIRQALAGALAVGASDNAESDVA
jgi:hypothetical protein